MWVYGCLGLNGLTCLEGSSPSRISTRIMLDQASVAYMDRNIHHRMKLSYSKNIDYNSMRSIPVGHKK